MSAPYPPGQPQWPGNPRRPEPIQFQPAQPTPQGNKVLAWTLRIAGLVAVAVISGLAWWYINDDKSPAASGNGNGGEASTQHSGAYDFTPHDDVPDPKVDDGCADHAYEDVKTFFKSTDCERLTRVLYVTKVDGRTVYTSLAVVRMHDEAESAQLRDLTDKNGTGNVNDLVREGVVKIDGLKWLSKGYASKQSGQHVVIVESAFAKADEGDKKADEKILDEVSEDALPLAEQFMGKSGY